MEQSKFMWHGWFRAEEEERDLGEGQREDQRGGDMKYYSVGSNLYLSIPPPSLLASGFSLCCSLQRPFPLPFHPPKTIIPLQTSLGHHLVWSPHCLGSGFLDILGALCPSDTPTVSHTPVTSAEKGHISKLLFFFIVKNGLFPFFNQSHAQSKRRM